MHDPLAARANELKAQEQFLYLGCLGNFVLFIGLIVGGSVLVVSAFNETSRRDRGDEAAQMRVEQERIREVLDAQVSAWNKGDLDGFMAGYWHDEQLTFISGDRITQGWDATRARYLKKYFTPDKDGKLAERGELSFAELQVEGFTPTVAMVRGRYILKLATETATGRFTLSFLKLPDGWRIRSDHTSVDCPDCGEKKEKR